MEVLLYVVLALTAVLVSCRLAFNQVRNMPADQLAGALYSLMYLPW